MAYEIALGIDPGLRTTGWGLVKKRGSTIEALDYGTIQPPVDGELVDRIGLIYERVSALIIETRPDLVAIESVFHHKSAQAAFKLAHARAAAMVAAHHSSVPVVEIAPADAKKSVVGHGRATKHQVQQMVKVLLALPEVPQADAADGLALAIAALLRGGISRGLSRS